MLVPPTSCLSLTIHVSERSELRSVALQCPNLFLAEPRGNLRRLFAIWGDAQQLATALRDVALSKVLRSKTRCGEAAASPQAALRSQPRKQALYAAGRQRSAARSLGNDDALDPPTPPMRNHEKDASSSTKASNKKAHGGQ